MFRPLLAIIVAIIMAMLAWPAGADIYKWTDAQGKVHYGDKPLNTGDANRFNPQVAKEAEAQAVELRRKAAEAETRKRLEKAKASDAAAKLQAEEKRRADLCQRARSNLEVLQQPNINVTAVDSEGNKRQLGEHDKRLAVERANQNIAENCGPLPQ